MTPDQQRNFDSIVHIVHDWSMLIRAGKKTAEYHEPPLNHFIQHAFLVECRKFADFFRNNAGPFKNDMISSVYLPKSTVFTPPLPQWDYWRDHMNKHLMHLSYSRLNNKDSWDGSANPQLLAEFKQTWSDFMLCVDGLYKSEFEKELKSRGM